MLHPRFLLQVRWVSRSEELEEVLLYLLLLFPAVSKHVALCCWSSPAYLTLGHGGGKKALSYIRVASPGDLLGLFHSFSLAESLVCS